MQPDPTREVRAGGQAGAQAGREGGLQQYSKTGFQTGSGTGMKTTNMIFKDRLAMPKKSMVFMINQDE